MSQLYSQVKPTSITSFSMYEVISSTFRTQQVGKMNVRCQKVGKTVTPLGLPSKAGGMWGGVPRGKLQGVQ